MSSLSITTLAVITKTYGYFETKIYQIIFYYFDNKLNRVFRIRNEEVTQT